MVKFTTIKGGFKEAQFHTYLHENVTTFVLGKFLDSAGSNNVVGEFIHCTKYVMVEPKPEPTVERTIAFVAKTVAKAGKEESTMPFFEAVVNFLLDSHTANDKVVRYRTCQILAQTVEHLGDAELDDELCDRMLECMHTRLSDKLPSVRVQAIRALARLQDPSDKQCPIVKAFLFLMDCDPNWQVRVECLKSIAPTRRTLLAMIERTRDVNEVIRRTAYIILAEKISVKALTISQRLNLLENGLADRAESVKKNCVDRLLQAWLVHYQANILDLLSGLDIMSSGDVCAQAVAILLAKAPLDEILDGFDLLDDKQLLDMERLSCESVFYYRVLLDFVSKQGDAAAEQMEKLVPDAKEFISFVKRIAQKIIQSDGDGSEVELERRATNEYIIQQLILCIQYIDVSDPVSRRSVLNLCKDLLSSDYVSLSIVPDLVGCLKRITPKPTDMIAEVASIISDIQCPIPVEELQVLKPEQLQRLKVKHAGVTVDLIELSDLLDEAVKKKDFAVAAEIKSKIDVLEVSKKALEEEMNPKPVMQHSQPKNDDVTRLKCLTIFAAMLRSPDMLAMTDTIRSYLDELIIPAIPASCPATRNQAVKALGLTCLCNQDTAKQYLPIFLQICHLDTEAVRVSALQSLFDIVLMFGGEFLNESSNTRAGALPIPSKRSRTADDSDKENEGSEVGEGEEDEVEEKEDDLNDSKAAARSFNDLISLMVSGLEDDSAMVRSLCAEGLAKLLIASRISSYRLLSRLIILWYNPVTEDDTKLRHCLGVFFPAYAFMSRANQLQIEEAFMPTLQVLFDAPKTSPLSEIDELNVAQLLVQLTDHKQLKAEINDTTETIFTCHDSLAVKICNEMLDQGSGYYGLRTLSKVLTMLDVSMDNDILGKDLKTLIKRLLREVHEKQVIKTLQKFESRVEVMKGTADSTLTDPAEDETLKENGGDETGQGAKEKENTVVDEMEEEIDSTVLEANAAAHKLKRNAARRARSAVLQQYKQAENSPDSDDSDKPVNKTRRIKVPQLEDDSD